MGPCQASGAVRSIYREVLAALNGEFAKMYADGGRRLHYNCKRLGKEAKPSFMAYALWENRSGPFVATAFTEACSTA
jgi:hypothetical protein